MKIKIVNIIKNLSDQLKEVADIYKKDGIVVIRGLSFNEDIKEYKRIYPNNQHQYDVLPLAKEQFKLVKELGDILGWIPNKNTESWEDIIVENHSRLEAPSQSPNDLIISWHLEHVDYDMYDPLLASVWSMWHCKLEPGGQSGNTWFIDSEKIYKELDEEEGEFLSKCFLTWYDIDGSGPHLGNAVVNHWLTKNKIIRIEITPEVEVNLFRFDNEVPTIAHIEKFKLIFKKVMDIVENNKNLRMVHQWEENDVVIPDLQRMAHTVTGGFNSKDRIFTNFFVYAKDPRSLEETEKPLIWRKDWTEKMFGNKTI